MLLLWSTLCAQAQTQDIGVWTAMLSAPEFTDHVRGWLDVHARRDGDRFLAIVRPGVGWQITPQVSAWAGYAWIPSLPDDRDLFNEHRIWEQVTVTIPLGDRMNIQSRTRFEQRFAQGGGTVGLRIREFVRFSILPRREEAVRLALWDELFVGLNDNPLARPGFDQNRLFVGFGLPIRHGGRMEIGVLNVLAQRSDLQVTWVLAANWFVPRDTFRRKDG